VAVFVTPFLASCWCAVGLCPRPYCRLRRCDVGSGRSQAGGLPASHALRSGSASGHRSPEPACASGTWSAPWGPAPAHARSATRPRSPRALPTPPPSRRATVCLLRDAPPLCGPHRPAPPVSIPRHQALRRWRATATIPRRRPRLRPCPQRGCSPWGRARCGGTRRQPQALSRALARLGALPAGAMPCAAAVGPRAEGGGVRPLRAPPACRWRTARPPHTSRTPRQARVLPRPWRLRRGGPFVVTAAAAVWSPARRAAAHGARRGAPATPGSPACGRRWRRPAGSGGPSPRRRGAPGWGPALPGGSARPGDARQPWRRLRPRVRARVAGVKARGPGRRSAAATRGTRTSRPTCRAPATWRRSLGRHVGTARRAGWARRWRRVPARRDESTTPGATPGGTHHRWSPPPARPAASPRRTGASAGSPQRA
jgi:hypothetical protein